MWKKLDLMTLVYFISQTKESWSAFDIGFTPNCDSSSPSKKGEESWDDTLHHCQLMVTFMLQVTHYENDQADTRCLLQARHVQSTGEATGRRCLQPCGPSTHPVANDKQLTQYLCDGPCSREAPRVRGCAS